MEIPVCTMLTRRQFLGAPLLAAALPIPDRLVVLTFDDAVKSHRAFVAPLLKEFGFRATFFVSHLWMNHTEHFMSWRDIAEIHEMGFEIGNHTWTHADFSVPRIAARLAGELALVENELGNVGVPRPISFAWPGNMFGPEALRILQSRGYRLARRGLSPEREYGKIAVGPVFDPAQHHPLLIPTTGDGYPDWTFDHFRKVVSAGGPGKAVVLQFHGVPDIAHPWVHTPPEMFRRYMQYLKDEGFRTAALRDLAPYLPDPPDDPLLQTRFRGKPVPAVEVEATRRDAAYWRANLDRHRYAPAEIGDALPEPPPAPVAGPLSDLLPYPGLARHPRIGFLDGAIDPKRGTKASVFLPWDPSSYVVVDLPEAIFSNLGLLFLAHTHIPTIWDARNVVIDNVDWIREPDGSLRSAWRLPNGVEFGAMARYDGSLRMELWLTNGTSEPLTGLRTQVCVMLKGAAGFDKQTNDNKTFRQTVAGVSHGNRRILTEWERCGRTWGNPDCPCLHSDPVLPDCPPGETVRVRGKLWFDVSKSV
jgi:peptidoglycan/xylan/chitin deacetylase (PgdA/CDA1 family)